jgi:hypothetical protein
MRGRAWLVVVGLAACGGGTRGKPPADTCTADVHCHREGAQPVCDPGFVRAAPDSPTDLSCVVPPCMDELAEVVSFPARVIGTSTYFAQPALSYTGSELAALEFRAQPGTTKGNVVFATWATDGTPSIAETQVNGAPIETGGYGVGTALVWTGSGYGAAWGGTVLFASYNRPHVFFAPLDGAGKPKLPSFAVSPDYGAGGPVEDPVDASDPAVAWSGSDYVVSWSDIRVKDPRVNGINLAYWEGIYLRHIDERGVTGGEQQLTQHGWAPFSVIAYASSVAGAWGYRSTSGATSYDVESKTISAGVVPPDPGMTVASSVPSNTLAVAAARSQGGELRIAAVRGDPAKLELYRASAPDQPVAIAMAAQIPAVVLASHGEDWLVTWVDDQGMVSLSRVDAAGVVTTRLIGALNVKQGPRLFAPLLDDHRMYVPLRASSDSSVASPTTVAALASICL